MQKRTLIAILILLIALTSVFGQNANTQLSNLNATTNINSVLQPNASGTLDLGTSTRPWRDLYLSKDLYLGGFRFLSYGNNANANTLVGIYAGNNLTTGSANTAMGCGALTFNTTGQLNSAFGYLSLGYNTSGDDNSAFGVQTLASNTTGESNSAFGVNSLLSNTSGIRNSAFGGSSLLYNTTGEDNCAFGESAMLYNNTGHFNCAFGVGSLSSNVSGSNNIAMGFASLFSNTTGHENVAIGGLGGNTTGIQNTALGYSLSLNSTGSNNTAAGYHSLHNNQSSNNSAFGAYALEKSTTGSGLAAFGYTTLNKNTTGNDNSGFGVEALYKNTTGYSNTGLGRSALINNINGNDNTSVGMNSLLSNTSGVRNTAVGNWALSSNISGNNNTAIGYGSGTAGTLQNNSTAIGNGAITTATSQARIGNTSVLSIGGQVGWTTLSDGNFKMDCKQNVPGLEFINQLKPVTYHIDVKALNKKLNIPDSMIDREAVLIKEKILYTGFIAQEVEKAAKNMGYDFSGVDIPKNENDFYGLRYAEFVVPIVKALQELDAKNDELQVQNDALVKEVENLKSVLYNENRVTKTESSNWIQQNVPNPFTSTTTIRYSVNENCKKAFIKIFSTNGKEVASKPIVQKGKGEVIIEAGALFPGIYSYSLFIDGKSIDAKLMILTK
ncbi:MAG TPA: tail fiber domain-containing protein [Bacteroidia bacterium]|nr:tail fiber domain-containing protein [Bacteroidia bacterium]